MSKAKRSTRPSANTGLAMSERNALSPHWVSCGWLEQDGHRQQVDGPAPDVAEHAGARTSVGVGVPPAPDGDVPPVLDRRRSRGAAGRAGRRGRRR